MNDNSFTNSYFQTQPILVFIFQISTTFSLSAKKLNKKKYFKTVQFNSSLKRSMHLIQFMGYVKEIIIINQLANFGNSHLSPNKTNLTTITKCLHHLRCSCNLVTL